MSPVRLAAAAWVFGVAGPTPMDPTRDYTSTVGFPDAVVRALWSQIVEQIGPTSSAEANTERTDASDRLFTKVRIETPTGYGVSDIEADVAQAVAALLPRFGHPVQLSVLGGGPRIEVTVGGCYRHDPGHVITPMEAQLARAYQRC